MRAWLWVFLYSLFIFSTIPLARGVQKFVYSTIGKEFFTYIVLFTIFVSILLLLYYLVFRLQIRKVSQYIWLLLCAGLYSYYTIKLKKHPEEAIHLLEYGLLGYLSFRALSRRIHDRTIYLISILIVLFIGTLDEFIQWMMPERFWGFRDIGINTLAGAISMVGLWKGIRPGIISEHVRGYSINMILWLITVDLFFLGLCLSNTPKTVDYYTDRVTLLSWLKDEEPMVEYGYKHRDPEIGILYSRLDRKRLKEIDHLYGDSYGREISGFINSAMTYEDLTMLYSPSTNPFLYEFILHLERRDAAMKELKESKDSYGAERGGIIAFKENLILERYFSNTLRHSGLKLPDEILKEHGREVSLNSEIYISKVGNLITEFNLRNVWSVILMTIIVLWIGGSLYKKHL